MAHAYSPEAIRRSIDFGVRSIEHGNLIDRATAGHVAGADAFVVPTLVSYDALHRFGPELGSPKLSLAKLGEVREAGLQRWRSCEEPASRSALAFRTSGNPPSSSPRSQAICS
jgi:imidazolonepropionase-like amidohydrolase